MMLLTIIASILIAGMSIYQFSEQARDYHEKRLERKEQAVKESIAYTLRKTDFQISTERLPDIFRDEIYEVSNLHGMPIYMYDLQGRLLKSSKAQFVTDSSRVQLQERIIDSLRSSPTSRFVDKYERDGMNYRSSYTFLTNSQFKNIGILNVEYQENDDFMRSELEEFLKRLSLVYIAMFILSIILGYFLSKYITRSIRKITDKMERLHIDRRNEKIEISSSGTQEINTLLDSYNSMVDKLEESAVLLAKSERENAWREMAKQVAHEIKNPLTPMRLTVQSFQRKFDPEDPDVTEKVREFCNTLVEQIDVMSSIASAFSTYASMPAQQSEETDVPMVTRLALDIFNENYIHYDSDTESVLAVFDRTQLIRVVTNLVKNAIQATAAGDDSRIDVQVSHDEERVFVKVRDNGTGIHPDHVDKIFEPKFTTKTSGMGLGLAMVKQIVENFNGTIDMETEYGEFTEFTVCIPRSKS
jgi:nitrogen fixation/metabolism regulation signal transduction histidine kinase